jgi:hypothetical protein
MGFMKMKLTAFVAAALLFSMLACKKDPPVITPGNKARLSVKLNSSYLDAAKVDSAFAIWNFSGQQQRIKMLIRNDSLVADIALFQEGNGEITIQVFSNKKFRNQYYSQWIFKKSITITRNREISYNGPASFFDAGWFPRAELVDGIGHKAVIGLRPEDSYFLVKDIPGGLYQLSIDKGFWNTIGGVSLAGRGVWACSTDCLAAATTIENDDFFDFMPERIGNKQWNHISARVFYEMDDGGGWILELEYEP